MCDYVSRSAKFLSFFWRIYLIVFYRLAKRKQRNDTTENYRKLYCGQYPKLTIGLPRCIPAVSPPKWVADYLFHWPTHFLGSFLGISGHRVHEHTYRCTLNFFSHSQGCLGISQAQPGQQIVLSAQYRTLAVGMASLFVLYPMEYGNKFLSQQKKKLWWVLMCLCEHVFMAAAFKSQFLPLSALSVHVALWRHNRAQTVRLVFFSKPYFQ